ncbi:VWA domain-containing protein [Solihabitans fulvus]|uniref:VWA domain-containing protein n=1 Tax=Solihabitans fulvus TaxID=1892852 RepID=A0A5B2XCW9_9PSEU|nr:VWA domain-containing protein [Solihabitans fulvus]KAA2261578.1 VWA domain-containing protein [Solihabitans fulvus]
MTKAMNQIADANAEVDNDQTHSALHFDGENFAGGQSRVVGLFANVVADLKGENAAQARTDFGGALHTIQDFYAHSDWIELGNTGANPDLGRPGHTLGPVAGPTEGTCNGSLVTTTKLTSGYYGGEDVAAPAGVAKCRHGGPFDHGPGSGGINKDLNNSLFSPHSTQHAAAAAAAIAGTEQFIRDIKAAVSARQLKLLLGVGPTLGMSIDTTGSMGGIISSVQAQAIQITDKRIGTDEEPSRYVLAPFNDPSVGPLTTTDDPVTFKNAISALTASGGGDCPELAMSGLLQAVGAMDEGSDLFTFTDADAKDADLADTVSNLAASKDIRIYPMLFGNCTGDLAARSQQPQAQQPQANQHAATGALAVPAFTAPKPFQDVARATGGQVFALSTADAGSITQLADALVRSNAVNLLNVSTPLTAAGQSVTVPVDSTLSRVTFSASGAAASAQTVTITRPDGTTVAPGDPGVQVISVPNSAPATITTITAPSAGSWTVTLSGSGTTSLRVTGESGLDLANFRFLPTDEVSTDPARTGVRAIDGFPVAGQQVGADGTLTDGFASAHFELRAPDGSPVQSLGLSQYGNEFAAPITVPSVPFLVYVTGVDTAGTAFQRMLPGVVTPQSLVVRAPPSATLVPGTATSFAFTVANLGAADTFSVTATDDHGYVRSATPATLTLDAGATGTVTVVLQPPAGTADGTTDALTVGAASGARRNFAVLSNAVLAAPPDTTPPTVTATVTPTPNAAGWNNQDVTVALAATDEPGGSGVASVTYSTGGASTTVPGASATVPITTDGVTTVTYSAVDETGNTSSGQVTVRLDKTAPALTCQATPDHLWPPTFQLMPIRVSVTVADGLSGPGQFTLQSVTTSSGPHPQDIVGWTTGTADTQGYLRAMIDGAHDRVYTLTYQGVDVAGNVGTCQATVRVTVLPPLLLRRIA